MTTEIKTIAVIGAGGQGREIARAALFAGYRVTLEDVSEKRLAHAVDWIAHVNPEARSRLIAASEMEEAIREADLIVEAVTEEEEVKIEMFTRFDKFAKPGAIFASSSHLLAIEELAAVTFCPERCIGMRLVSRIRQAEAFELVPTPGTSEETVARCREVVRRMGKDVMVMPKREFTESL
jgi:3-hydroxybutyryl-CoA dehydrogenase